MNETAIKILVAGPSGAGKTTLIRTLSQSPVVNTDVPCSTANRATTVAMDFGQLHLDRYAIHLFGAPGQDRFDFAWEILLEGCLGLLLLVSGKDAAQFPQARRIYDFLISRNPVPLVLGITHQDHPNCWKCKEVASYLDLDPAAVVPIDATNLESATELLVRLFELIDGG
ncbi:Predicted GTPase [Methylacidimicrobium sp. AP8]|uniref:GTP-binding protein n=1 Tax=Methylacidimicrobium sp. AP8 TaxID=2730359 RepID=UPI0018BFB103|nr:ATP/GTP-binding protein [Methylacidimicrobium sp. AP8]CAB4244669.1 Predicted GTPase [Methylacidimicrobium sp. AP8]